MCLFFRWWAEHRFGDGIPVLEEVFPLFNLSVDDQPCSPAAVTMRRHAGHAAAQLLEAQYHSRFRFNKQSSLFN